MSLLSLFVVRRCCCYGCVCVVSLLSLLFLWLSVLFVVVLFVVVVVVFCQIVVFGLFGCVFDPVIRLCASSVAWSSAIVSTSIDVRPLCIAIPPIASVTVWLVVLLSGLIAFIFHPVLLSLFALHAPSEDMKIFTHCLKYRSVSVLLYLYSFMLLSSM